ncbi:MAG: hypothetical protein JW726_08130 [Anaerolineales bacterium]|nr:hypothetical protein [Anaerolineales bacterium]
MNCTKTWRTGIVAFTLFALLLTSSSTVAAPNTPTYSFSLSPTSATQSTAKVTLTISSLLGQNPPSAHWYGPSGAQVSPACSGSSNLVREYIYVGGVLFEVRDYFYISPCNRDPGTYRVEVGWEYEGTFTISESPPPPPPTYLTLLPLVQKSPLLYGPFSKLSPADGVTGAQTTSLTLDWGVSTGISNYAFCFDTSDDNACTNWVETGASTQASIDGLIKETTYYWQVRAVASQETIYADGAETAYWSFTTGKPLVGTWTEMTSAAEWTARKSHSSVALPDGSIVLVGGFDGTNYHNDVWRSIDQGSTWTQMTAAAPWVARSGTYTTVALPDGSIVLMGGYDGTNYRNDVWRSTNNGANWTQMTAAAEWVGRSGGFSSAALPDGSIVLMGGYNTSGGYRSDVWRSTDNGASWTQMTAAAEWSARTSHSSVALTDGSIVLMGGNNSSGRLNDVWRSTDNGASWTQMTANAEWAARIYHACVALPDGSIILMGGYDGTNYFNDMWHSTDNGATWVEVTNNAPWVERAGSSVVLPDGSIVLMGGNSNSGRLNDVWRFEP